MWTKTLSLLLLLSTFSESLLVVPSSPQCAALCGNTLSSTSGAEMTCHDSDYATSAYGATFKACIACELSSTYYDTASKQADLRWAIYNLRYALSWCLFGFGNNTNIASTPCLTSFSCAPLQNAVEYDSLNPNATAYSFCPLFTASQNSVRSCTDCMRQTGNENFIANFITVLDAACGQQPVLGKTLSLQGNIFSTQKVNITSPTAIPTSSYTPQTGGLTLEAKIGIAVAAFVVLLATLGFCIVWRGKRRRKAVLAAHQRSSGYLAWQQVQKGEVSQGSSFPGNAMIAAPKEQFFDSPQSQRPLKRALSWEYGSPESATAEKAYFSPYHSNYNSPVSALDGPSHAGHAGPWPTDNKTIAFAMSEPAIEMENVDAKDSRGPGWRQAPPPVLQHPGLGRGFYEDSGHDMEIRRGHPL